MLEETPSVNNMIKTVGQPRTDFDSVSYDDIRQLILHHLHFYQKHTILLLVNHCMKKSLWLMHIYVLYDVFDFA
jgi:hypothetical protein